MKHNLKKALKHVEASDGNVSVNFNYKLFCEWIYRIHNEMSQIEKRNNKEDGKVTNKIDTVLETIQVISFAAFGLFSLVEMIYLIQVIAV